MSTYFRCKTCTDKIKSDIDYVLSFDISEVTFNDYLNETKEIMNDKTLDDIKGVIDKVLNSSNHVCNGTDHIWIYYGNDGPFVHTNECGKVKILYSILLNPENDTFRIIDDYDDDYE